MLHVREVGRVLDADVSHSLVREAKQRQQEPDVDLQNLHYGRKRTTDTDNQTSRFGSTALCTWYLERQAQTRN